MEDIKHWKEKGSRVVILSGAKSRGEMLTEALANRNIEAVWRNQAVGLNRESGNNPWNLAHGL